jgi:phosphopantothenoylcysteine decarboxylase/phosphopantothenate--cysteine ligase
MVTKVPNIHPSKDIISSKSRLLEGWKIALGICGSVAAIRSPEIARELMRNGAEVWAVMTESAQKLISPQLMEWATGNPVVTELTGRIEHVELGGGFSGSANLLLIAPATANTIGKIAAGIDDTPVTSLATTSIGSKLPIVLVPAMHRSMYDHLVVQQNMKKLESLGIRIIQPEIVEDKAKIADIGTIVEEVIFLLGKKDLQRTRVLVTAGPTRSYMDAIRYLTNSSSGKMGFAFASESLARGAKVTLITGPTVIPPPNTNIIKVETTEEMLQSVRSELKKSYDLLVMAAAPLDFAIANRTKEKLPGDAPLKLNLTPMPKIIKEARLLSKKLFIIGFKAEHGLSSKDLISKAQKRLAESGMDLIVANDLSSPDTGFGADTDEVYVLDAKGLIAHIPLSKKQEIARKVLDIFVERRKR